MSDRINRSVGLDPEDWDWLAKRGQQTGRTQAAELRVLVKWAIGLQEQGFAPNQDLPTNQMNHPKEELREELREELQEGLEKKTANLVREELAKYRIGTRDGPSSKTAKGKEERAS